MTQIGQENRVILTADDFTGSPFRLLRRVGGKLYRPTQVHAVDAAGTPMASASARPVPSGVQIWDWG